MDELGLYDCPMPETFREKFGIIFFLTWLFYLGFVSRVIFGPLLPSIQEDLGLSNGQTGLLFFFITLGYLFGPFCSGLFSSRIDHLGSLKISNWLLGFSLLLFLFINSFWQLSLCLLAVGFAGALHLPSAIATISAEIQKSDWGKGLGLHQCAPPLAFFSAPLLAAYTLHVYSWRIVLVGWGLLVLCSALAYSIWGKGGEFPGKVVNPGTIGTVVKIPSFWVVVLLIGLGMAGNAGIFAMLPLFFVKERGFELETINTIIGFSQVSGLFVVFWAGMLVDRFGQRLFMTVTLGGAGLLTILIGLLDGGLLVAVLFLQPIVLTSFFPAVFGALARIVHPTLRSVVSAVGPPLSFLLGAGLVPLGIGYLSESFSLGAGIITTGIVMVMATQLVKYLRLGDFDNEAGC